MSRILLLGKELTLTTQSGLLMTLRKRPFENIVAKGENAGNQHFLLFPQCFLTIPKRISDFKLHVQCILSSANAFNLNKSKILLCNKQHTFIHFLYTKILKPRERGFGNNVENGKQYHYLH